MDWKPHPIQCLMNSLVVSFSTDGCNRTYMDKFFNTQFQCNIYHIRRAFHIDLHEIIGPCRIKRYESGTMIHLVTSLHGLRQTINIQYIALDPMNVGKLFLSEQIAFLFAVDANQLNILLLQQVPDEVGSQQT